MDIKSKEDALFARWRASVPDLVQDGVADENEYLQSSSRVAFVLKESNDLGGGGWDLRTFLTEGGRWQTWNNVARWVHALRALPHSAEWQYYEEIDEAFRQKQLRTICAINVKKSPGSHTSKRSELLAAATRDAPLLSEQCSIADPDITIMCGTSEWTSLLAGSEPDEWRRTRRGIYWYERQPGNCVIEFAHPQARAASCILHYAFVDAVAEILESLDQSRN